MCNLDHPLINSHHDCILSSLKIDKQIESIRVEAKNLCAPKIPNDRLKIIWSDEGVADYQRLVVPQLHRLSELWLDPSSKNSTSLLLKSTNDVLSLSAKSTNRYITLSTKPQDKSHKIPRHLKSQAQFLLKMWKHVKILRQSHDSNSPILQEALHSYKLKKNLYRKSIRWNSPRLY